MNAPLLREYNSYQTSMLTRLTLFFLFVSKEAWLLLTFESENYSCCMNRIIKKVAVLGSGIMGSRIACHFANIGVNVLLLDIAPKELTPEEQTKGLTPDSKEVKNRIVN